jgi:hypothetical protein
MCAFANISTQLKLPAVWVSCGSSSSSSSSSCAGFAPALYGSLQGSHISCTRGLHLLM